MSAGNVDEETTALSSARTLLARGELQAAAVILLRVAKSATGTQARLVAELLIAAQLPRRDTMTLRLAAQCRSETMLSSSVESAAAQIRALVPDIVLYPELGTDGFTFALAAQRLAPAQVCAWGHQVTTGLPTIDAFYTCAAMEPVDAVSHYRERLIGLPHLRV